MIILSVIISICYCVFFIWLTEGLRKSSYQTIPHLDELPTVSIIISARNEEKNISNLLTSLSQLSYPLDKLEIIIVNDRSNDKTAQMLNIAEKELPLLNVIHIKETPLGWAPKKWALQQAIEKSKHEIILQTDADCTINTDWVQTMVSQFINLTMGFIAGPAPTRYNNDFYDQFALMDSLSIDAVSSSHYGIQSPTGNSVLSIVESSPFAELGPLEDIPGIKEDALAYPNPMSLSAGIGTIG